MARRSVGDEPVKIVLQHSARLVRDGLAALLEEDAGFEVVGLVATHDELLEIATRTRPDVVIVELGPDDDMAALLRHLQGRDRDLRVVALHDLTPRSVEGARNAGVTVVSLRSGVDSLLDVLPDPVAVSRNPDAEPADVSDDDVIEPLLTHRELQVLAGVGDGLTKREIAVALDISPRTVENDKHCIFAKLGAQNQAHAVAVAMRRGLLGPARSSTGRTGRASMTSSPRSPP